ncbi:MAG TPA: VOC family protein [Tepidisphaeraceae bacterium]|jgi:hypothetical protein
MPPTLANGKICYIEIPAADIGRSSDFYGKVFGWNIRTRGDGATAFDDGVGEVSGAWRHGRPPTSEVGLLIYVMVDSVEATMGTVSANGGEIIQAIGGDPGEITARFRDPAGNIIGLYQDPGRTAALSAKKKSKPQKKRKAGARPTKKKAAKKRR